MRLTEEEFTYLIDSHERALEDIKTLKAIGICIDKSSDIYNALEEYLYHFSTLYFDKVGCDWIYWYLHREDINPPEHSIYLPDTVSTLWNIVSIYKISNYINK